MPPRLQNLLAAVFAIAAVLAPSSALATTDGLSRNMLHAEAAIGREDYALAAEYLAAECDADGPLGCYRLAIFEQQGIANTYNPDRAAELYWRACELGYAEGCASLAEQLLAGEAAAPEVGEGNTFAFAERLSGIACEHNSGLGCYNLALIRAGVYEQEPRPEEATALLEKACRLAYASACQRLGDQATRDGVGQAQWSQIAGWYHSACDAGSTDGCMLAGMLAAEGQAGQANGEAARRYFEQGCEMNSARACRLLGEFLLQGTLLPVDEEAAAQAHRRADELFSPPDPTDPS